MGLLAERDAGLCVITHKFNTDSGGPSLLGHSTTTKSSTIKTRLMEERLNRTTLHLITMECFYRFVVEVMEVVHALLSYEADDSGFAEGASTTLS